MNYAVAIFDQFDLQNYLYKVTAKSDGRAIFEAIKLYANSQIADQKLLPQEGQELVDQFVTCNTVQEYIEKSEGGDLYITVISL